LRPFEQALVSRADIDQATTALDDLVGSDILAEHFLH
jgi:hypothetical protein